MTTTQSTMIRPSSLPMLAQCPAFVSAGPSEFSEQGTRRHEALRAYFGGDESALSGLDEESIEAIKWAAEYIRVHAPMSDYPIAWEERQTWVRPDFTEVSGTPDAVCGPCIFDFKWRRRDYAAQMADYSLALLERWPAVTVHILYGAVQRADMLVFDRETAETIVGTVLSRAASPQPTPCDYCGWCGKKLICPALVNPATQIAHGYSDGKLGILNWHPSDMQSAEEIDTALLVARVVAKWCESVEYHAKEAVIKQGITLPHFELKERRGKQYVADTMSAYTRSGLGPETFLKACEPRLNSTKSEPVRPGLVDLYAEHKQLSRAAAKRELERILGDAITRGKSTVSLVAKGEEGETMQGE